MTDFKLLKGLFYGLGFTDEQIEKALKKTKEIVEKQGLIKKERMMRTIKFRGERIDNKEWVYGYLYKLSLPNGDVCMILTQDNTHLDNRLEPKYHLAFTLGVDLFVVDPNTVGQFTSLYDKNHNEIYEGDILAVQGMDEKLEVRFVRGVFAFLWNGDLDNEFPTCSPTHEWAEVIGNIYDNPELLKGENK